MKASQFSGIRIVLLSLTLLFFSCAKKIHFSTSPVVPAAQGSVKYSKDHNKNYKIKVEIVNLADPKRLSPARNGYVLWMQTERNGLKNLGQIVSSTGWLSSTRKASLSAVTPFEPKSFFITAEENSNTSYPGEMVVLRTD